MSDSSSSNNNNSADGDGEGGESIPQLPTPVVTQSTTNNQLGYCHECDMQVNINKDDFVCSRCNSGFIEILDENSTTQQQQQQQQQPQQLPLAQLLQTIAQQVQQQQGGAATAPRPPAGRGHMLGHLLGHAHGLHRHPGGANIRLISNNNNTNPRMATTTGQINPNGVNFQNIFGPTATTTTTNTGNNQQQQQQATGGIPGEQFDLYGIINNVLSDILDPQRQQQQQQQQQQQTGTSNPTNNFQFHFPPVQMFQLHGNMGDYVWGTNGLDQIISQLLNQLENTGPPPATATQLDNLPIVTIDESDVERNLECAICMDDFQLNDKGRKLPCKHIFHEACITEWLRLHGTCPVCRKNMNGEDTSQREYISQAPPPPPTTSTTTTATATTTNDQNPTNLPSTTTTTTTTTNPNNNNNNPDAPVDDMDFD